METETKKEEPLQIYTIPENYNEIGMLGGAIKPRNLIEAISVTLLVDYACWRWLPLIVEAKIVIVVMASVVLLAIITLGKHNESLGQYLIAYTTCKMKRRTYHLRKVGESGHEPTE